MSTAAAYLLTKGLQIKEKAYFTYTGVENNEEFGWFLDILIMITFNGML